MIPDLFIVIVNWNLKEDTRAAIDSLVEAGAELQQIILVDNGSTDGSADWLEENFGGQLRLIRIDHNTGFTGGNNQGVEAAYQAGAEWVLLLNNDTLVPKDFFTQFENVRSQKDGFSILTPVVFYAAQPEIIWNMGAYRMLGSPLARIFAKNRPLPPGLPALLPVDFVNGCAMFIHRKVYEKIGLFDPAFFAYWEDNDFCYRARQAGFRIATMTQTTMLHKVSLTAGRDTPRKQYLYTRNMIWYLRKNTPGLQKASMQVYLLLRFLFTLVKALFTRQIHLIPPTLRGWKDGWRKRPVCD